jgi:DNA primase
LDELPPQTRSLLRLMHAMVKDMAKTQNIPAREVRFTRRDVREATRWSDNQLKVHCTRLSEMEYLLTHGGTRGHYLQYELLYDGQDDGAAHLMGLIDPAELDNDARKLGQEERKLPSSWPQVAPELVPSWTPTIEAAQGLQADLPETAQNAPLVKTGPASSLAAAVV